MNNEKRIIAFRAFIPPELPYNIGKRLRAPCIFHLLLYYAKRRLPTLFACSFGTKLIKKSETSPILRKFFC